MDLIKWFKEKMEEMVTEGSYLSSFKIMLLNDEFANADGENLQWLFDYYNVDDFEIYSIDDELTICDNYQKIRNITIWLKNRYNYGTTK